jgi:hypothetical protein
MANQRRRLRPAPCPGAFRAPEQGTGPDGPRLRAPAARQASLHGSAPRLDCHDRDAEASIKMNHEELLGEVEDILRTMPPRETLRQPTDENFAWLGRVSAFIEAWDSPKSVPLGIAMDQFHGQMARDASEGLRKILTLLHHARHDLRMKTLGPVNAAIGHGRVFDYFDEVRKIIEPARQDLLFVDPYLDAEFVSRYLPHVAGGVSIRLLARDRVQTLLPAVDMFARQSGDRVNVRSATGFHDRYVIVDRAACYQSGASFKDGAKAAPTTLTQITDAFTVVLQTYEDLWNRAKVEL